MASIIRTHTYISCSSTGHICNVLNNSWITYSIWMELFYQNYGYLLQLNEHDRMSPWAHRHRTHSHFLLLFNVCLKSRQTRVLMWEFSDGQQQRRLFSFVTFSCVVSSGHNRFDLILFDWHIQKPKWKDEVDSWKQLYLRMKKVKSCVYSPIKCFIMHLFVRLLVHLPMQTNIQQ